MTFSLRGVSIPNDGSGRVNITNIGGSYSHYPLICRSELPISGSGYWYLHPTQKSTASNDIIFTPPTDRGWNRTEDIDSEGHRLVKLGNMHYPDEGVFTCHIPGDRDTPRSVGVYYPSEL